MFLIICLRKSVCIISSQSLMTAKRGPWSVWLELLKCFMKVSHTIKITEIIIICLSTSIHRALGQRYNIPVSLWLKESYPRSAPLCFVKPTPEMVTVTSRHINSDGEILMPYLDEWRHVSLNMLQYWPAAILFYEVICSFVFYTDAVWPAQLDSGYEGRV